MRTTTAAVFLAVMAVAVSGCSSSPAPPYAFEFTQNGHGIGLDTCGHVSVDLTGFTPAQQAQVIDAVDEWARIVGIKVAAGNVSNADVSFKVQALNYGFSAFTSVGEDRTASGRGLLSTAIIYIDPTLLSAGGNDLKISVLHELGHVSGLADVNNPAELMYGKFTAARPTDYAAGDLAGLAALKPSCY